MNTTKGLLVRLQGQAGKDKEIEDFLHSLRPLAQQEAGTMAWFAVKFEDRDFGIFDTFADDDARGMHLNGPIGQALQHRAPDLFSAEIEIEEVDILARKLPLEGDAGPVTKGMLLRLKADDTHREHLEGFLRDTHPLVEDEPRTLAWFALNFGGGEYGVFDAFADDGARNAHLAHNVLREATPDAASAAAAPSRSGDVIELGAHSARHRNQLARHVLTLLEGVPKPALCDILAEKISTPAV